MTEPTPAPVDLDALRARFTEEPVPPCRLCGRDLRIAEMGGGKFTLWACSDYDEHPKYSDAWFDHYRLSKWYQTRPGDPDVLALIDELAAARAYPTPDAYAAACAALYKHRDRADALAEHMAWVRDQVYRFGLDSDRDAVLELRQRVHARACDAVNADREARNALPKQAVS